MTVEELIEALSEYPKDKDVIVYDSEYDVFRELIGVDSQEGNPILDFDSEWQLQLCPD